MKNVNEILKLIKLSIFYFGARNGENYQYNNPLIDLCRISLIYPLRHYRNDYL